VDSNCLQRERATRRAAIPRTKKDFFSKVHSVGEEVWDPPANGPTGDQRGGPAGAQDAWQRTPRLGPLKDDVEQQLAGKIE
jgi:hypothetical protein